ncbi:SDR family NAD(P)-dependent oxidoreductase [Paenibacillus glycanilyticus]|uniref:SDR family NAD(P)-dependent oxidoreductase n=1 Tax=Paenibacillus glycanilyticus TaxID=126569 RepID=UPI00203D6096|nr:SDR family NAD(P)-dependent oxidoreductase [Paenibacillus glycanilyticus]MCM3625789.1 SDR family NAD(P)-dependent oxidoreductase [Paenibacillus glycanilyticus]
MVKTMLVTGADRGVGLALTAQWLQDGSRVFAGQYADSAGLQELQKEYGEQLSVFPLDVASETSVKQAFEWVESRTDRLDVLINNAAILGEIGNTIHDELQYEEMLSVFNVNALGSLRMSQTFTPLLLQSDSKLIANISSEAGSIADCWRDAWYAYCMSKAAVNMQSKLIHNGLKPQGGRVLVIHPGWVQTHMQGKLDEAAELTPKQSAAGITKVIHSAIGREASAMECEYVDYEGRKLKW